jgi:hypothetical protein
VTVPRNRSHETDPEKLAEVQAPSPTKGNRPLGEQAPRTVPKSPTKGIDHQENRSSNRAKSPTKGNRLVSELAPRQGKKSNQEEKAQGNRSR